MNDHSSVDRLLWLVGREAASGRPLHAVRGEDVYCGHEGALEVLPVLWPDRRSLSRGDGPEPCAGCRRVRPRQGVREGVTFLELYTGRVGPDDRAIHARVIELTPEPPPGQKWEFRVDVGRARFDEQFGSYTAVWRGLVPDVAPPRRRVLP